MSAMRAEDLPEFPPLPEPPAALPQDRASRDRASKDSARTRAATRWTAPLDLPAFLDPPAQRRQQARPRQAQAQSRPQAANPPLRLTRRGRIVVAVAAALVLGGLSLGIADAAQAASGPAAPSPARQGLTQVTVHPGQNLWSVAESADPSADTRVVVQRIIDLNGLTGNVVFAGQRLWVPRG